MSLSPSEIPPTADPGASNSAAGEPSTTPRQGGWVLRRWLIGLVAVGVGCAICHRQLREAVHRQMAGYHAAIASEQMESQNTKAAMTSVEKALEWLPDDPPLVYLRAQVYAESKEWDASLADYARLIDELAPEFASAYIKRAVVYEKQAAYDDALSDLERACELSPSDEPSLLNHRAYVRALAGSDLEKGLQEIDRAIELYAQNVKEANLELKTPAAYVDTRGFLLFRAGHLEEALSVINQALELLVDERKKILDALAKRKAPAGTIMRELDLMQGEIVFHRAQIYESLKRLDDATKDFQLAKELGYKPTVKLEE